MRMDESQFLYGPGVPMGARNKDTEAPICSVKALAGISSDRGSVALLVRLAAIPVARAAK
jgi:hypothetical protein